MTSQRFGSLLILVAAFMAFAMFVFSEWMPRLGFVENIRYAALFSIEECAMPEGEYFEECHDVINITLGQGLLIPGLMVLLGAVVRFEILSQEVVERLIPFVKNNE